MSKKKIKITNPPKFGDNVYPEDDVELVGTYEEVEVDDDEETEEVQETEQVVEEQVEEEPVPEQKSIEELAREDLVNVKVPVEEEEPVEENMEPPYMLIPKEQESVISTHVYRVRLSWEKRDTQIYAGNDIEVARVEARKHEGYKIYQDDNGMMIEDPWVKFDTEPKEQTLHEKLKDEGFARFIHPGSGVSIVLKDRPVYRFPDDAHPFTKVTGTFYFYDGNVVKGRAKITRKYNGEKLKKPSDIFGYIDTRL